MSKTIYIGIDPGKAGFITLFEPQLNEYSFLPMPEKKVPTGKISKTGKVEMKSEFNPEGFRALIINLNKKYLGYRKVAAIEQVNGRQGWSAENNFNFGHTAGLQLMILIMLKAEIEFVRPQKWQSVMYKGFSKVMIPSSTGKTMVNDTKATSALVAKAIAPDIDFRKTTRSKVTDDNKTDSFLICCYCYQRDIKKD